MKKSILTILLLTIIILTISAQLRVSESKRYLETTDGKPFLWIGDTAWELFHRLNREEAVEYLENRKAKGINVIQAVVLAERDGLRTPNPYGAIPFKNLDPTQPNEAYFEHVDFIVNEAEKLGLFIGMLPTWGDKIYSEHPGAGPIIFNKNNAFVYGEFLGSRYKNKPVVWILGGDRNIANEEVLEIWRAMAAGIKKGDEGNHLITYHPRGNSSSSKSLHNEEWLDFNMYQSGHDEKFNDVYRLAENDYHLQPIKPTIDGEPAYEDIAVKFWEFMDFSKNEKERVANGIIDEDGLIQDKSHFKEGFFDEYDVRVHAYWNFLAGACGYTYGNNAIWQMFKKGEGSAIPCLYDWRESMDRPGAFDLQYIRTLLEDKFYKIVPDQSIINGNPGEGENRIAAATSTDGSFALVYLAKGQTVQINLEQIGDKVKASWFNPGNGEYKKIGKFKNEKNITFSPPGSGTGNDWMLVLEKI
jgi:hypothetical protein